MSDWNPGFFAERLQQAAFDPAIWADALHDLSRSVGGAGAAIFSGRARALGTLASPDLLEVIDDYMNGGWREHDERRRAVPLGVARGAVVDQDFISPQEMRRSAFYEDFLARHGLRWFAGFPLDLGDEAGGLWGVSIHRSAAQGPFLPHEIERLRRLTPALAAAATIAVRLGHAHVDGLTHALDLIGRPCFILDESGDLMRANAAGDALLGRALDVSAGRIVFGDAASQSAFDGVVAEARLAGRGGAPRVVCVRDRSGYRHVLRIVEVSGAARHPFARAALIVMFEPAAAPERQMIAAFRTAFGFTPSEGRLACALMSGRSLAVAAHESGLTYETARSYLKAIFFKTGTHRQAELIALLAQFRN